MVLSALGGLLIGAVLGTRFRVLALIPAAVIGVVIIVATAAIQALAMSSSALAILGFVISLQIGYVAGLFTRYSLVAARGARQRSFRSSTART